MRLRKKTSRRAATTGLGEKGTKARALLLEAACDTLAEHGWEGATSRRVASRARLNLSLIRYYYGGLDAMLLAAVADAIVKLDFLLRPAVTSGDVIALLEHVHGLIRSQPGTQAYRVLRILSEATLKGARDPAVATDVRKFLVAFRTGLGSVVAASLPESMRADRAAVGAGAALLAATLEGMLLHSAVGLEFRVGALASVRERIVHLKVPARRVASGRPPVKSTPRGRVR